MRAFNLFQVPTRNNAIHSLILLTLFYIISLYFPLTKVEGNFLWQPLALVLLYIAAFYVHSLVLLPILLKRGNIRKYIVLTAFAFIVFYLLNLWFHALRSSAITYNMDWTRPDPLEIAIYNAVEVLWILLVAFIPASAVTLIYYILLLKPKEREELFSSKYVEPYINILLLIPLFILIIFNTASTMESRIDLFYILILLSMYFYLNALYLVNWLIKQKSIAKFIFLNTLFFGLIVAGIVAIYGIGFLHINWVDVCIIFILIFSLSFLYGYIRIKLRTNERIFNIKLGAKESELNLLKSQVNPHFLFNTLNMIYGTALEENASRTAESTAKVVFTTAYPEYALESYSFNAIDYLLKPFEFDRFKIAVDKVEERLRSREDKQVHFFIRDGFKNIKIFFEDIF